jgi:hypothetical protein
LDLVSWLGSKKGRTLMVGVSSDTHNTSTVTKFKHMSITDNAASVILSSGGNNVVISKVEPHEIKEGSKFGLDYLSILYREYKVEIVCS